MRHVEAFLHDIRYALRALGKTPAFAATALAALALGIGANTAIFSVLNTVLLKPLAYPAADRIVLFFQTTPTGPNYGASATKFNALRRQTAVFQDVSAYEYGGAGLNLTGGAHPEQIHGIRVSADYCRLFGAPLALGRAFTAEDRPNGAAPDHVRNAIVIEGMRLALAGVVIGEAAAFGLTRFMANFLFGVKMWDPLVFITVPVLLSAVALLAVGLPALRATRIDPVTALRCE